MKKNIQALFALIMSVFMAFALVSCELELAEEETEETAVSTSASGDEEYSAEVEETEDATEVTAAETGIDEQTISTEISFGDTGDDTYVEYHFRSKKLLDQHFQKHGGEFGEEFGYNTAEDYEEGASEVINSSEALHKTEKEDGDGVYYIESSNEFVVLSTDGYIRTYFRPDSGKKYYDKQ